MPRVYENVACTVCGCVCDDLRVSVKDDRIVGAEDACHLAEPWFFQQWPEDGPVAQIDGRPAEWDEAVGEAAAILTAAKAPLIFGLGRSSTDGARAALALADRLQATIDPVGSPQHAAWVAAMQRVGASTCTLGEVRNRADLVIYWGADPVNTHPRHLERYSLEPSGRFVPRGRADRTLVVVDREPTASSELADLFVRVEPGRDLEMLWALRALVGGVELETERIGGAPAEQLAELAGQMKRCRCGIVFFGRGLVRGRCGDRAVEGLLRLVRELNDHTRFYAQALGEANDVSGSGSVMCWQTGYPASVSFARGYPRYGPGEYSAASLLTRREVDACLIIGSGALNSLDSQSLEQLREIPLILLDPPTAEPVEQAKVRFTTSVYGIHLAGTARRMDDVPVPLAQLLTSQLPSDGQVLAAIEERLVESP
jgi:formylmethanofuran dehydrogenase subunit B